MFRKTVRKPRRPGEVEIVTVLPGQHIYPIAEDHTPDMNCSCGPIIEPGVYGPAAIHRDNEDRSTDWAGMSLSKARKYIRRHA